MSIDVDKLFPNGERGLSYDYQLNIMVTAPMKEALAQTAAHRHISMSDVVRQILARHTAVDFPEYDQLYAKAVEQERQRKVRSLSKKLKPGGRLDQIDDFDTAMSKTFTEE